MEGATKTPCQSSLNLECRLTFDGRVVVHRLVGFTNLVSLGKHK